MSDKARRKAPRTQHEQSPPAAGVYLIRHRETGRSLLGAASNLTSVRNKLAFAHSTGTAGVLDRRLSDDIRLYGAGAFTFDVLETLEQLRREKLDPALFY